MIAASAVVMQLGLGAVYAWSVFREPLSDLYGTNITNVNITFFILALMLGFAAFGAGSWMKRVGPRVVGVTGGVLFGLGVFLASFAEGNLFVLYLTHGFIAGIGVGMGYIVPIATLPKWFPDRPGLAAGIAVCGFGAGTGINVPIATSLIWWTGGPLPTFGILGIAYIVLVAGAALFMKDPPEEDYKPEGYEPSERDSSETAERGWDFRGALKTWQWYALWAMLFLNTTAGLALISDAKAMASDIGGATSTLASIFVVIVAAADVAGRLFWPALSDYIGPRNVFLTMFLLQAASFLLLPTLGYGAFVIFTVLSFVVLTCYGGGFGTMPPFTSKYYDSRELGTIYGAILTATGIATLGAPLILAMSKDATGSYDLALYLTAGLMLVSAVIPLVIRPPKSIRKGEAGAQEEAAE